MKQIARGDKCSDAYHLPFVDEDVTAADSLELIRS
jgi:hypothetical protein